MQEGQVVAAGQVIARIESDCLASRLAEVKARRAAQQEVVRCLTTGTRPQEIAAAEARLRNAKRLVGRLIPTARARATAKQELDDARAELDVARADADSARETLDLAREGFREEEIAGARALLKARDLVMTFTAPKGQSVTALTGVSIFAKQGRMTGLVAPDGAEKTTFLRIAAGLMPPTAGRMVVLGLDITGDAAGIRSRIGYMPQQFGLYEDLTVRENLNLCADLQGVPKPLRAERFDRLMAMADLVPFGARLAGRLSGGMNLWRIVEGPPDLHEVPEARGAVVAPAEPLFEDAFVDRLAAAGVGGHSGGIPVDAGSFAPAVASGELVVSVYNLTKRFGNFTAVREIGFRVRRGEVFGLLGANGAGKTTTFRMLCGLLPASEGEIRIAGRDLRRAPVRTRSRLGYMAQKFSLFLLAALGLARSRLAKRVPPP